VSVLIDAYVLANAGMLDARSLLACSHVSRDWRRIAADDVLWSQHFRREHKRVSLVALGSNSSWLQRYMTFKCEFDGINEVCAVALVFFAAAVAAARN